MLPWPTNSEALADLQRLQREELIAVTNGERDAMILCRLLWVKKYCASVGGSAAKMLGLVPKPSRDTGELVVPGWLLDEHARPLVKVVTREVYAVKYGHMPNQHANWYREKLACGHTLNLPADLFGAPAPKRRRCRQCAASWMEGKRDVHGVGHSVARKVGA